MKEILSLCYGIVVFLICLDISNTLRIWTFSPGLAQIHRSLWLKRFRLLGEKWLKQLSRATQKDSLWDEIAFSLAFHLKAGETLVQAIRGVSEEDTAAEHNSLKKVFQLYEAGTSIYSALDTVSRDEEGLSQIASILKIGAVSGGDLSTLLCHASEMIRRKRLFRSEARAKLAEAKITAVLLSLMPWVVGYLVSRYDPQLLTILIGAYQGKMLLVIGFVFWIVGNVAIVSLIRSAVPQSSR